MIAIVTVTTISPIWADWTYSQSTGKLSLNGKVVATGYAGRGAAKNNPDKQCAKNEGPIPRGKYSIGPAHNHKVLGPVAMFLNPNRGNNMCGRDGFFIHGPGKTPGASHGCIHLETSVRLKINSSKDKTLVVVK